MIGFTEVLLALLAAADPAASPSAETWLELETTQVRGCVDAARLRALLAPERPPGVKVRIILSEPEPGAVGLDVSLTGPRGREERSFRLRRVDCRLIPRLVRTVWDRYLAELPEPDRSETPADPPVPLPLASPAPEWPYRHRVWLEGVFAPGIAGAPRVGLRALWAVGRSGRPGWAGGLGYDLVPNVAVGAGRAWVHAAWLSVGPAIETRWFGLPVDLGILGVGGLALGHGTGFDDNRAELIPVARLRAFGRVRGWGGSEGWGVHAGLAAEGSAVDVRLSGSQEGSTYREPLFRTELVLGVSWSQTRW